MGDKGQRVRGVAIEKPIVYGSIAWWLGKKAEPEKTHKWSVYVRDPYNRDLSLVVDRVVFGLHESFHNSKRTVSRFPFEIFEFGWGEFEISITIHFKDPAERPVEMFHILKLYATDGTAPSVKKPVVSETYDEIVFQDPTKKMFAAVEMLPPEPGRMVAHPMAGIPYANFGAEGQLAAVKAAREVVQAEIEMLKEIYLRANSEAEELEQEVKSRNAIINPSLERGKR